MDFETLANEHKDSVYCQMIRACGNREDAEDVLVEALLTAYRHLGQLREVVAFRSWLAQIAKRVCWQLKKSLLPLLQLSAVEEEGREISSPEPSIEQQVALKQILGQTIPIATSLIVAKPWREFRILRRGK